MGVPGSRATVTPGCPRPIPNSMFPGACATLRSRKRPPASPAGIACGKFGSPVSVPVPRGSASHATRVLYRLHRTHSGFGSEGSNDTLFNRSCRGRREEPPCTGRFRRGLPPGGQNRNLGARRGGQQPSIDRTASSRTARKPSRGRTAQKGAGRPTGPYTEMLPHWSLFAKRRNPGEAGP